MQRGEVDAELVPQATEDAAAAAAATQTIEYTDDGVVVEWTRQGRQQQQQPGSTALASKRGSAASSSSGKAFKGRRVERQAVEKRGEVVVRCDGMTERVEEWRKVRAERAERVGESEMVKAGDGKGVREGGWSGKLDSGREEGSEEAQGRRGPRSRGVWLWQGRIPRGWLLRLFLTRPAWNGG